MPTYLYYTQGILDFQEETATYSEERLEIRLNRKKYQCPKCKSKDVTLTVLYERDGRGLPMGRIREVHFIYSLHTVENAKNILRNLRGNFQELGDTYMFKEALRTIYRVGQNAYQANIAFHRWCKLAEETLVPELTTMAKTLRDRLDGIVSYWTFGHASNASTEGFNNKIRWLTRQAYGFRDLEYFKLKIYQLPQINCEKAL